MPSAIVLNWRKQRINLTNTTSAIRRSAALAAHSWTLFAYYGGVAGRNPESNYVCVTEPSFCTAPGQPSVPVAPVGYGGYAEPAGQFHGSRQGHGINFNIPLRNRAAQATQVRSEFEYRQAQLRIQQIENQVRIEVRNAQFGVQQNRASVASAQAAVDLARQSLDAEQKKYALGASTSTLVLQNQAAMTQAEVTLVSAKALLRKAELARTGLLSNWIDAIGKLLPHCSITRK
jgi:outer membrane protein